MLLNGSRREKCGESKKLVLLMTVTFEAVVVDPDTDADAGVADEDDEVFCCLSLSTKKGPATMLMLLDTNSRTHKSYFSLPRCEKGNPSSNQTTTVTLNQTFHRLSIDAFSIHVACFDKIRQCL